MVPVRLRDAFSAFDRIAVFALVYIIGTVAAALGDVNQRAVLGAGGFGFVTAVCLR